MKSTKKRAYWFKRKRYGYGWVPVTWQGWGVLALYILVLMLSGLVLLKDVPDDTYQSEVGIFLALSIFSILPMYWIARKHGPKPKWRSGKRPDDNPDEDW